MPRPRRLLRRERTAALPYADEASWDETYDDADEVAQDYPARRLPHQSQQAIADKMLADTRWQEICEEISTHGGLDRHYLD